jgi:hypothetical protein
MLYTVTNEKSMQEMSGDVGISVGSIQSICHKYLIMVPSHNTPADSSLMAKKYPAMHKG